MERYHQERGAKDADVLGADERFDNEANREQGSGKCSANTLLSGSLWKDCTDRLQVAE